LIDSAGDLDLVEFELLAQKISNTNCVVDYIPLREIVEVDFEIVPKGGGARWGRRRQEQPGQDANDEASSAGFFKSVVAFIETQLAIDLDGDGISHEQIPHYDKEQEEFHLRIMTDPAGRYIVFIGIRTLVGARARMHTRVCLALPCSLCEKSKLWLRHSLWRTRPHAS